MGKDRNTNQGPLSRRLFLGLGAGAGASMLLAACGGGTDTPPGAGGGGGGGGGQFGEGKEYTGPSVSLAFWNGFTGGDGPFMRKLVDQFNGEHQNIKVSMNVLQWADFYPKVPTAVQSGNGPDIAIMHIDNLATNAARRVIIPVDEVATVLEYQEADFAPAVWQAGVWQEKRYGIPLDIHPLLQYHNEKFIGQAPTDLASFESTVKDAEGKGAQNPFWVTSTWPAHLIWWSLIHQFGGTPYSEDGSQAQFNSDAGVEALTWQVNNIQQGYSPKNVANDAQAVAFRQGKNVLTWDGIWMMNEWAKVKSLEWGAAPLPQIGDQPAVWASSHNFVVTSQAQKDPNKLQASKVFISWISDHSIDWAKAGQIAARASVRESPEFQELEVQNIAAQQLDYVKFPPAVPGIGEITAPTFELAVNEAVLGKKSPKAALDDATSKANELLAANKKKYGG
ncbi:MAG TPA: ABC transporter substrate-binding protein [Actinomycetota bacterium]|nr:ABC transporter substrate-binding protein [Actinomycetota bacterium]